MDSDALGNFTDTINISGTPTLTFRGWSDELPRVMKEEGVRHVTIVVTDGDLSALLELPKLRIASLGNKKHYRPSFKDVQAGLERRHGTFREQQHRAFEKQMEEARTRRDD